MGFKDLYWVGDSETTRLKQALYNIDMRGQASKEDLLQIQEVGIPVFKLLEDNTGKPIKDLLASAITPEMVIDSINKSELFNLDLL